MELGFVATVISAIALVYGAVIAIICTRAIYRSLANVAAPVRRLHIVVDDRRSGKVD